jgi:hypothetical protein
MKTKMCAFPGLRLGRDIHTGSGSISHGLTRSRSNVVSHWTMMLLISLSTDRLGSSGLQEIRFFS